MSDTTTIDPESNMLGFEQYLEIQSLVWPSA